MSRARLPDYIIIGAGKSGTTTLHHWLGQQPEIFATSLKEPRFFSRDWHKGIDWYTGLFAASPPHLLVGEASTNYTDVEYSEMAAARMAATVPAARLVYLLRHPVERLRSQYRHNWRRAVESAPLAEAVQRTDNPYVGRSLYFSRLRPYIDCFPAEQLCVVRFEDLVSSEVPGWAAVLAHLGLVERRPPGGAHNVTADQAQVSPMVRRLEDLGLAARLPAVPAVVRGWAKQALQRAPSRPPADSRAELPGAVVDQLWADVERLEAWLGVDELWERTN